MDVSQSRQDRVDTESLPLREAAKRLGVSVESLRKRAQRGTIAAHKVQTLDGETWYVSLPVGGHGQDRNGQDSGQPSLVDANTAEIIAVLREQLAVKDAQIHRLMQIIAVQSANTLPSGERAQEGTEPAVASREDELPVPASNIARDGAQRPERASRGVVGRVRRWWGRG